MNFLAKLVSRLLPPTEEGSLAVGERRESVRLNFEVDLEVQAGSNTHQARLLNLTFTGLCLEVPVALIEGQELVLKRPDAGAPFRGTVLWTKVKEGGLHLVGVEAELDEDKLVNSWLEPTLVEAGFLAEFLDEKRRLVRVPGKLQCKLTNLSGEVIGRGQMLDLSTGGALLEWGTALEPGQDVKFEAHPLSTVAALTGTAKITSCRQKESGQWHCGMQFDKVDGEAVKKTMASMMHS